jgi:holin-like protein
VIGALATLLCCQLAGELIARVTSLPVPGPVIGLLLLFALLVARRSAPAELQAVADGLLRHLSLLFVPAGVGIMLHAARLEAEWPAIAAAIVISTGLTIVVTALVFRLASRLVPAGDDPAGPP